eukprot:s172_g25.t1
MRFTFPGEPLLAEYDSYDSYDPEVAAERKPVPRLSRPWRPCPKSPESSLESIESPQCREPLRFQERQDTRPRRCSTCRWKPAPVSLLVLVFVALIWTIPYSRDLLDYFEKADRVVLVDGQRYAAVQYFGFNLFTAPGTEVDGCFDIGDDLDQCYLGSPKVKEDVEKRLSIMFEAVERLYASDHWDRSPTTLKIFMLPEFYWRGKQGAYRIHRGVEKVLHPTAHWISHRFTHERFKHWLIVDGTVVMAQMADQRYVEMSERPYENISYYNFAPVHVGGTNLTYLRFKHFISGIDFLQMRPEHSRMVPAPPGRSHSFCKEHPRSNGCVYQHLPSHLLEELGFGHDVELPSGLLKIGGLRIGLEICLDHAMGELCEKELKPWERVDVQLIVSAGMNIASGPVCTRPGGPVFLADGFARTEVSLNAFGRGRQSAPLPVKGRRFDVGIDYGADVMVSMQQWLGDSISKLTGTGFGTRFPGVGTMPGEAMPFKQISALGDDWLQQLQGFYHTGSYVEAASAQKALDTALAAAGAGGVAKPKVFPTIDIYGPLTLRLPLLLQRLQPEQRRAVIARLTQGQQMQLERWVLAQKSFTVMKEYGKARRLEPKNWRYGAGKGSRKRPAIDDAQQQERCCGTGIYQRFRSGRSTYEATCAAGPFVLSTRWTANLDLAVKYKQMLQSVRERMEESSAEIQVSFKEAIMTELHEHGFTAKELNLTFLTRVGARYWVGRSLETPRFLAEGPSLERGLMAWQRLREARLTVFEGACNELSLLSRHSPGELADAWGQLRSVYLDVMEESGHQRQRVLRRLERLEKKQEPRRLKAEQRWRALAGLGSSE